MALNYSATSYGSTIVVQQNEGEKEPRKYKCSFRLSNAFGTLIWVSKINVEGKTMYKHTLVNYFFDEQHLKDCIRHEQPYSSYVTGKMTCIKLNLYYKEAKQMLEYLTKEGLKVQCYYKEPKEK